MSGVSIQAIDEIRERIERAALRSDRDPGGIRLIVVTKGVALETIRPLVVAAGARDLGENRIQEAEPKIEDLGHECSWHFLGHLQRNKVRQAVGVFETIQSVDRLDLAVEIDRRAAQKNIRQGVLIQINVAGESRKHGATPEEACDLVREVSGMTHLNLKGLMAIPPYPEAPEDSRSHYRRLHSISRSIESEQGVALTELSMGMSLDFEVAIEEGATMVRVGTAIFRPSGMMNA